MTQPFIEDPVLLLMIGVKNRMHEAQDAAERVAYGDAMKIAHEAVKMAYDQGRKDGRKQGHDEGYEDGYDSAVAHLAKAARAAGHPNS